jgi:hypothetical protein
MKQTPPHHQQWMMVLAALLRYREQLLVVPRRGSSRVGKVKNKNRHQLAGAILLDSDYFADDAANTSKKFWRHFHMKKELFMKIVIGMREYNDYFQCKPNCTGQYGFSLVCTAVLRCIAYGAHCDTNEDYLRMAVTTCFETVSRFCRAVMPVFGKDYL